MVNERALNEAMRDALMLLYWKRPSPLVRTNGKVPLASGTWVLAATADALERRGLAWCHHRQHGLVGLTPEGLEVAERLHQERVAAFREFERERLAARAAGLPPAPVLRVVR